MHLRIIWERIWAKDLEAVIKEGFEREISSLMRRLESRKGCWVTVSKEEIIVSDLLRERAL